MQYGGTEIMINIIVAMDERGGIGKNNKIPWHLPADLKYFRLRTLYNAVVMGRKTFESIGKPLDKRLNIVLTKNYNYYHKGVLIYNTVEDVFRIYRKLEKLWIIGGLEIYKLFLPYAHRLYITHIHHTFDTDIQLHIDFNEWKLISKVQGIVDEANPFPHDFAVYQKVQSMEE